jgi:hypothetical protein
MKIIYLTLLLVCIGCASVKRNTTITTTDVTTRIDTAFIYKHDTIPIFKYGTIHDTVKVENTSASATAYFDVGTQRIVLKLEGKPFEVHIYVNSHIRVTTVAKVVERKNNNLQIYIIALIAGIIVGGYIAYKIVKK